ncbi:MULTISPECIES: outer membrane beta-barrel protein [Reichenbachiella]|uniref:Outer membrane protein beta-barrel domain-containing protein n=1 Tax=Reichenbachiella agariperforans TaxID=156994 RepID=A0A1M6TTK6_REIAG|nr:MULTISPECIES: outer membrane beta-barrel protein [Reichenbachiella]MBU2915571.1 outer membrane beta-barrel protein [Reichenbachiella agariperforans]RJE71366.1 hypothetical protein BGP76_04510 [Reichenbachiella sp. MSK19-1]SHK60259.1 Outer membrane protein beta-barrel domain-containing protein [Reichenbachiella agariperforans]
MKNRITVILGALTLLLTLHIEANAQLSEEVTKKTPELPGELMVDFGFNLMTGKPGYWSDTHWWRSKSVAIYFVKPFELSKKIEFRPGIGVSLDKLGSKNGDFLGDKYEDVDDDWSYTKAQYSLNYAEIPMEFRFNITGNDHKASPFISVGGMAGIIFDQKTKVKYDLDGKTRKIKEKGDQGTSKLRLGAQARIGWGSFSIFYKQYFTPVFTSRGPLDGEDITYSTIGVSISGF